MPPLDSWGPGEQIRAAKLNQAVQRLNEQAAFNLGGNAIQVPGFGQPYPVAIVGIWIMNVGTTGPLGTEPDRTDCTYWLIKQQCVNDYVVDTDPYVAIQLSAEVLPDEAPLIVCGTNLSELVSDSHSLAPGQSVIVFGVQARQADGTLYPLVKYFLMEQNGGFWATITAHSSTNATNWSPYTATTDAGGTVSITNSFEHNGVSATAIQGSPGSLGVNVASDGTVNGGSCVVQAIGNARVWVVWDNVYSRFAFSAANSAQ